MLDLKYAMENINKYKFDYNGYLVIVDKIRTQDILNNQNIQIMKILLLSMEEKYKKELLIIRKHENIEYIKKIDKKMIKEKIIERLKYIYDRLPAIGFIRLGLEKEIVVDITSTTN